MFTDCYEDAQVTKLKSETEKATMEAKSLALVAVAENNAKGIEV